MMESWSYYTDDFDYNTEIRMSSLLPSSMMDVVNDFQQAPESNTFIQAKPQIGAFNSIKEEMIVTEALNSNLKVENSDPELSYYKIYFHAKRTQICSVTSNIHVNVNDYVITEADRGLDMGIIISSATENDGRDQKIIHKIVRLATKNEVDSLPEKKKKEERSVALCQSTVQGQRLNMKIIDAELQFDGTQLTFYYTTNHYIDFRSLVRVLFRTFGTRIWMVWYDGHAPVKDVFSQNERKKKAKQKK